MRRRLAGVALALAVLCGAAAGYAQTPPPRLATGGTSARSGVHPLRAGFAPDPFELAVRPGGSLHVAPMRLGAGCRGYVAAQPDVIVRFSGALPLLRFFARSATDLTLVVGDPSGRFLCNDDAIPGRNTSPMVDVHSPRPGQYDVWIGTHAAGEEVAATLYVTGQRTQRP